MLQIFSPQEVPHELESMKVSGHVKIQILNNFLFGIFGFSGMWSIEVGSYQNFGGACRLHPQGPSFTCFQGLSSRLPWDANNYLSLDTLSYPKDFNIPQQLVKVKQSRYRPGVAQRVPGS